MDSGVGAVLEAAVGGPASLIGSALALRAREKRDAARREEEANRTSLVAARIVQGDLAWAETRIKQARENKKYWSPRYALRRESWFTYREVLALSLDPDDWLRVRNAFRKIDALELETEARREIAHATSRPTLTDYGQKQVARGLEAVRAATRVLDPYAKGLGFEEPEIDEGPEPE
jgi:hypothetical protein